MKTIKYDSMTLHADLLPLDNKNRYYKKGQKVSFNNDGKLYNFTVAKNSYEKDKLSDGTIKLKVIFSGYKKKVIE